MNIKNTFGNMKKTSMAKEKEDFVSKNKKNVFAAKPSTCNHEAPLMKKMTHDLHCKRVVKH